MRVAHVGNYRPESADGVKSVRAALARHLPEAGVDVEMWHLDAEAKTIIERTLEGVSVVDLPAGPTSFHTLFALPKATVAWLRQRSRDIDLVHMHSAFAPINLAVARHVNLYVVSPHNGYHQRVLAGRKRAFKRAWLATLELPYLRRASLVHVATEAEAADVRALTRTSRIAVIPNGIAESYLQRSVPSPSAGRHWAFLGRLDTQAKGLDLLLRAYAVVANEQDVPDLVLAGPDFRGDRAELERLAKALRVEGRVRFVGSLAGEDKVTHLTTARAVLQPSRWEGMSLALLEALALGRPVLVTPGTNLAAEVANAGAGVAVEGSVEGVAAGLRSLLEVSPTDLDDMGARARRWAGGCFAWPVVARRMAEVYRSVAA